MINSPPDHSAGPQSSYRAYLFGRGGKIEQAVEIAAVTDEEAITQAQALDRPDALELWDRSRFVVRLPPVVNR